MEYKEFITPMVVEEKFHGENILCIVPEYSSKGIDLMKKGDKFYCVYDQQTGMWCEDESMLCDVIDRKLYEKRSKISQQDENGIYRTNKGIPVYVRDIEHSSSKKLGELNRWIKDLPKEFNYRQLNENLTFASDKVGLKDYRSKRLPYDIKFGSIKSYTELMNVLYSPEEKMKLEWAVGAVLTGESKNIDKMVILYGKPGTGKSTVLWIIREIFKGYCSTFVASKIADHNNQFATAAFKDNPLVAIQDDGSLAKITDTTINSIISHEPVEINEKGKAQYTIIPQAMLFLATNDRVDIRDIGLGITRRFIDVYPTGEKIPRERYEILKSQIKFEIPAIAYHCVDVFNKHRNDYKDYRPEKMIHISNPMINFIFENYDKIVKVDYIKLNDVYPMYKTWYEDSGYLYPPKKMDFKEEFKEYFTEGFFEEKMIDGKRVTSVFVGFNPDKLRYHNDIPTDTDDKTWLRFAAGPSIFDATHSEQFAQLSTKDGKPKQKWKNVHTTLSDINTTLQHFVKLPENEIVIDFDLKDEDGKKSFDKNIEAASKWPETYAELSRSGSGIHLHYIYDGDPNELEKIYGEDIEIQRQVGDWALRRKLSECNDIPIATINGANLPKRRRKEKDVLNERSYKTEKQLRYFIRDCIQKKHHGATKPEIDYIKSELDKTYNSGEHYDVSDLFQEVMNFAAGSTNQAVKCLRIVDEMHFCSDDMSNNVEIDDDRPIVFFDIEVFPNLLLVNWKYQGADKKVVRMINPMPSDIENLFKSYKMIGFNNRRYDNHVLYARMQGYSIEGCYNLSQKIINDKSINSLFSEAYNLSYTDVYDFANMDNKMSLKKWEIKLDIHHQELDLPWDQPVPEELWNKVAEYCDNDVIATEAVFNACHGDWLARQILASISGLTVNDTTNKHTEKIIFGDAKKPQQEFNYVDLSKDFPGYSFDATRKPKSLYMGEDPGEGGYVYAEPGIYHDVALLDIASMHPSSLEAMNLLGVYTKNFSDLKRVRILIKHGDFDKAGEMFDGKLKPYLSNKDDAKALSNALKIAINSVYGLTSAKFDNKFKDPRNVDNIVAKRGALFMINLKHEVQAKGYTVAHIKTDSIKIPNATQEIIQFVMDYGQKYGYTFEHEATYSKMCLVNDAVYIAQYQDGEHEFELSTGEKIMTSWTATGAEFQHPYIFKTLFAKKPVSFRDYCETKTVQTGIMYLDMNEGSDADQHNYQFVGRAGSFCPIKPGKNGGELMVLRDDKYSAVTKTKGWRWLEAEDVKLMNRQEDIDQSYFDQLNSDVIEHINEYGNFDSFVAGSEEPVTNFMNKPE